MALQVAYSRKVAQIERIAARDGWKCHYCHVELGFAPGQEPPTRDHVIPLSRGGRRGDLNVVLACRACNERKADAMPEGFDVREGAYGRLYPREIAQRVNSKPLMERCRHTHPAAICLNCTRP